MCYFLFAGDHSFEFLTRCNVGHLCLCQTFEMRESFIE